MFTSCEKETFSIGTVETPAAKLSIAAYVYDAETGEQVTGANYSWSVNGGAATSGSSIYQLTAGSDKTIAAANVALTTVVGDSHIDGSLAISTPEVKAGETLFIPASVFMLPSTSIIESFNTVETGTATTADETVEGGSADNETDKAVTTEVAYTAVIGSEITNIDAIIAAIDAMDASRAYGAEDVKKAMRALVNSMNKKFTNVERKKEVTIPAMSEVKLTNKVSKKKNTYTLEVVIEGNTYTVEGLEINSVEGNTVTEEFTSLGHDHGHGHGGSSNAGGGIGGK
ncbi:MAG: hypothetical protein ACRC3Z_10650 [Phocaeicola sp.]